MIRLLRGVAVCVLPVLAGLWVAATEFGGTLVPWHPVMVDLEVYRRAGRVLLEGGDFYALPGQLQFLYPPLAAVLSVPLALLPDVVVQVGWTVGSTMALLAVLHRFGLRSWPLSLLGSVAVVLAQPVSQTLGFGQLGTFLVALVVLDLVPGPRVLRRRLLPQGSWTAFAAAIKLTPAIFVIYLLVVRRIRAFVTAILVGLGLTLLAATVTPRASYAFWSRLVHGDTGLGHSIIYFTNQSVLADIVRIFGLGRGASLAGLGLSALVAALGVWVAVLWHRRGDVGLAVNLCGVAGLLASPVSWLHHFVWVVPLALSLLNGIFLDRSGASRLPAWFRALGLAFVAWVVIEPFKDLPNGADVELQWSAAQNLLASVTALLGVALLVAAVVLGLRQPK